MLIGGTAGCGDDDDGADATDDPTTTATTVVDDGAELDRFATLDENGDSFLDVDEVGEYVDDSGTFDEWDIDRDSELDRDDLSGNAFEHWDADGNGRISESEWTTGSATWLPEGSDLVELTDVDEDGDSELDADEVAEAFDFSPLGEFEGGAVDQETFERFYFVLYDEDDDGKVSEVEWNEGIAIYGTADQ